MNSLTPAVALLTQFAMIYLAHSTVLLVGAWVLIRCGRWMRPARRWCVGSLAVVIGFAVACWGPRLAVGENPRLESLSSASRRTTDEPRLSDWHEIDRELDGLDAELDRVGQLLNRLPQTAGSRSLGRQLLLRRSELRQRQALRRARRAAQ